MQNREIRLVSRPEGLPTERNFEIRDTKVGKPVAGEVLLRTLYISVDPYLRGRMREGRSYIAPFEVGQVIVSGAVAEVIDSASPALKAGDVVVSGSLPWQLYSVANAQTVQKIDPTVAPISTALGVLGMPGLTAYFGLLDIGKPQAGETVVVSGAAGAVGTVVCQIAKIKGCRVIAIAGSAEKTDFLLRELGVDVAINYKDGNRYKSAEELRKEVAASCPGGVNVYFDNVGGEISDGVLPLISSRARIVVCGLISQYNSQKLEVGLRPQPFLLVNSALMQGFIITQYAQRFGEGVRELGNWLTEGKLKYAETIVDGFDNTPKAFIGLFKGENLGKQIVKVAEFRLP
jgi:NADPH:quinone reductase